MVKKVKRKNRATRRPRARATDILGNLGTPPRIASKWEKHYKRLLELRHHLVSRQNDLAKDAVEEAPAFSMHMADAGTDVYDRDFALSMMSLEQDGLYEIDQALSRIQQGVYGICELTGKRIERERLEAIPWTRFSAAAEMRLESEGGMPRARLGSLQEVPKHTAAEEEEPEEG